MVDRPGCLKHMAMVRVFPLPHLNQDPWFLLRTMICVSFPFGSMCYVRYFCNGVS